MEKFSIYVVGESKSTEDLLQKFYSFGLKAELCALDDQFFERVNEDKQKGLVIVETDDLDLQKYASFLQALPIAVLNNKTLNDLAAVNVKAQYFPKQHSISALAEEIISYFSWWQESHKSKPSVNFTKAILRNSNLNKISWTMFCSNHTETRFLDEHLSDITEKNLINLKRFSLIGAGIMSKLNADYVKDLGFLHFVTGIGFRHGIWEFVSEKKTSGKTISRLKDVAIMTSIRLKNERLTESIHRIASFLEGQKVNLTQIEIVYLMAKEVYLSCFPRGVFRPNGAYLLLNSLSQEPNVEPSIKEAVTDFIAEVISDRIAKVLASPKKLSKDQIRKIFHVINDPLMPDEQVVDLKDLKQGLKTAKPIVDFEGRKLVDQDTILDKEIIERLVKIACLVPILDPIVKKED
ncbi:MAG: hypothetical protein NZT61_01100 [Deltaproteobacteria bacterium]|nr:hypothetical protein [Deltaproteobacteria bacterium]